MDVISFDEFLERGKKKPFEAVFSIGVFDGVHYGHRTILETLRRKKEELRAALSLVFTFSHNPKGREGCLDTLRLRSGYIASYGVDILVLIDFSAEFSKITAGGFVDMISSAMIPSGAVFGEDFRFGNPLHDADGIMLGKMLEEKGFVCSIDIVDSVLNDDGVKISSTLLRQMIKNGEVECIPALSGQFYRVDLVPLPYRLCSGELIISRKLIHQLLPPLGAYDAELLADGKKIKCMMILDGKDLHLVSDYFSSCHEEAGKGILRLDSLYLEKRR